MADQLPKSGLASTYADSFVGKPTSSGEVYSHLKYTAALLPRARWHAVPMGTLLQLSCKGRQVVVKVNDRGAGDGTLGRVLDLSRAAYAYLAGVPATVVTDRNADLLQLTSIEVAPSDTPVGPVKPPS